LAVGKNLQPNKKAEKKRACGVTQLATFKGKNPDREHGKPAEKKYIKGGYERGQTEQGGIQVGSHKKQKGNQSQESRKGGEEKIAYLVKRDRKSTKR